MFAPIEAGGLTYYVPRPWQDRPVVAGFTTRRGGVSSPPYDSLNLGFHVGDNPARVRENRRRALLGLGLDPHALVVCEQVHGRAVAVVDGAARAKDAGGEAALVPGVDGMLSEASGVVLGAFFADCIPIFYWDPVRPAVGLVHAGWRGTLAGIAREGVLALQAAFGTDPARCQVAIGPGIGPCCFEVGEDVAADFLQAWGPGGPGWLVEDAPVERREGRYHVDLWRANLDWLLAAGVSTAHISLARLCPRCRTDLFFSHRGAGGPTGRMAAFISLPPAGQDSPSLPRTV